MGWPTRSAGATSVLSWNDNSISETGYGVQRSTDGGLTWNNLGVVDSPLNVPNTSGTTRSYIDTSRVQGTAYTYRVLALNTVGYGGAYPSMTVQSASPTLLVGAPAAPSNVNATAAPSGGYATVTVTWTDNCQQRDLLHDSAGD